MVTMMNYGAPQTIFKHAEKLRNNMTASEKIIWEKACKNQFGARIGRQHPIWKYIADFYCHDLKLVIEIDGGIHLKKENKEYDITREITLREFGIEIIRFTNDDFLNKIEFVIEKIKAKIEELKLKKIQKLNQKSMAVTSPPLGDLGAN